MKSAIAGMTALMLGLGLAAATAADPVTIRVGWIGAPGQLDPILFAKPGIAKHLGVSYKLDAVHFSASPTEITSLAAGELEIATLGFSSVSIAILNAGMTDTRIIADEIRDGTEGYFSMNYSVLKDSPIKTIEDLRGKTLATNGLGAGVDILMRSVMLKHGLEFKRDYNIVEVQFPNMRAVLADHKVDLITATLPFVYDPEMEKIARPLFVARDGLGQSALSFWTARAGFLEKNRAAMVDLLEDYVRASRWYMDPANHKEAVAIAANFMKLPPEAFDSWVFTKRDWYRDPDAIPDLNAIQLNINAQRDLGFIKGDLDINKFADLSLVKEAVQRIK